MHALQDLIVYLPNAPVGPPLPETIVLSDSDDDEEMEDEAQKILPPTGFSREDYKTKTQRGAPAQEAHSQPRGPR